MMAHKHKAIESGKLFSRCEWCLTPMTRAKVWRGIPYPARSWRASKSSRVAILAGPVWEYR